MRIKRFLAAAIAAALLVCSFPSNAIAHLYKPTIENVIESVIDSIKENSHFNKPNINNYTHDISYRIEFRDSASGLELIHGLYFDRGIDGEKLAAGDEAFAEAATIPGYTLIGDDFAGIVLGSNSEENVIVFLYSKDKVYDIVTIECRLLSFSGKTLYSTEQDESDMGEPNIRGYELAPGLSQPLLRIADDGSKVAVYAYRRDDSQWARIIFDPQTASPAYECHILLGMSLDSYNELPNKAAYPSVQPPEPFLSGWHFAGWHEGLGSQAKQYSSGEEQQADRVFTARYEKMVSAYFLIDPHSTGRGSFSGGESIVHIEKKVTRYNSQSTSQAVLDETDIPECFPASDSRFAGWKGSNVSGEVWSAAFSDADTNYARFDKMLASNPPLTGDGSRSGLYATALLVSAAAIILIAALAKYKSA
ncbi:MAG: hypothetical protein FWG30_00155 [Eubacteriaceae bacterium]|nr:hypothetical protein [Eubacteriaceae bacterium]